jgi:GDP-L-fucose synthase
MEKILVTGGSGLVGSAVVDTIQKAYPKAMVYSHCSGQYDLTREKDVDYIYDTLHKPGYKLDAVIHCAARVGGIGRNLNTPYKQFISNILMNTLVIEGAVSRGIKNLIAFSSACAFPKDVKVMSESNLHDGEPFPAHRSYAYSKRMVDIQIEALMKEYPQFNYNYCSVIPGSIFGPDDNFDLENGHVVPSLIRKAHKAAELNQPLVVWGTGEAVREFIYSEDIAKACIRLLLRDTMPQRILVSGKAFKIKEIAEIIAEFFNIKLDFDSSKPDGQMVRITDKEVFNHTLPGFDYTDIKESLHSTIRWYCDNFPRVRGI